MTDGVQSFPIVPNPTKDLLSDRQVVDYKGQRERFVDWLQHFGKEPEKANGYSDYTVRDTMYRTDRFWRWVWTEYTTDSDENFNYTLSIDHKTGDEYLKELARRDWSASGKATAYRALQRLFKYRQYEYDQPEWEPVLAFSTSRMGQPRDFLTREERRDIREAAMEYGAIPGYSDLTPDARDRWKLYLAQRLGKPKNEVIPEDWNRVNGWKIPSLVWASLDAGLRPVEVKRAKTSWVDIENERLIIPSEESSKNRDNWKPPLTDRTINALSRWLEQRVTYDYYDESDRIWLTGHGNPYSSGSLRYLMQRLFEIADIPTENRQTSWYMIRHSTGTYMAREEGLEAARQQLRHQSPETTMRYDQAPEKDRRDALDRMG
jgi:integrase